MIDDAETDEASARLVVERLATEGLTGRAFDPNEIAADVELRLDMDRGLDALIGVDDADSPQPFAAMFTRSVPELATALRSGALTSTDLAETFLAAEAATQDQLHSFVMVDSDRLLAEAAQADSELSAGRDRGLLHGVLIGVKDIIDVAGYPTRCGSPIYPDAPVETNADVITHLRAAGALVAGKTTTHELACGVVSGPASNPWNPNYAPGGSSGGSGAAVSAGLVPIGLGSDTGGSIRIPAALCGVVGHKPTHRLVSLRGVEPLSVSLDHLGPLGATVADCAHALTAMAANGIDYASQLGHGIAGMRFGVLTNAPFAPLQPDVEVAFHTALDVLRSLDVECVPVDIPELEHTLAVAFGIIPLEAYTYHQRSLRERGLDIDPSIRTLLTAGAVLPLSLFRRAVAARARIAQAMADAMTAHRVNAFITPTLPATAPLKVQSEHRYGDAVEDITTSYVRTTAPFNLSGQPAISVPCGFDRSGLPIGLQIATRAGTDALTLRVAAAYERETPWSSLMPSQQRYAT
ncbi:MAG: Asp-tRNA(Asn)/Glu-tRNA(Gln) amidotransferase GatCAB subunit A [Actinobacteria bacterium]|nr:Asp-tRNA(Asn)/Glu-tRNA(Gln) amidotransferase GatCAB subunit A [Actinomycetota bacterium]NCG36916.1 Asp-tRNA(Asn)/Glu-tRNA(Gln) amidotransferase GatCAB subunit A [Actinomycetota bacterium]